MTTTTNDSRTLPSYFVLHAHERQSEHFANADTAAMRGDWLAIVGDLANRGVKGSPTSPDGTGDLYDRCRLFAFWTAIHGRVNYTVKGRYRTESVRFDHSDAPEEFATDLWMILSGSLPDQFPNFTRWGANRCRMQAHNRTKSARTRAKIERKAAEHRSEVVSVGDHWSDMVDVRVEVLESVASDDVDRTIIGHLKAGTRQADIGALVGMSQPAVHYRIGILRHKAEMTAK